MARTLSDTLIVAVLEAATRLTGARGPIAGSAAANTAASAQNAAVATPPAGAAEGAAATGATAAPAPETKPSGDGAAPSAPSGGERDTRSADEIAADFKTIYAQIEELVRASAEQETKVVGFGPRQ